MDYMDPDVPKKAVKLNHSLTNFSSLLLPIIHYIFSLFACIKDIDATAREILFLK